MVVPFAPPEPDATELAYLEDFVNTDPKAADILTRFLVRNGLVLNWYRHLQQNKGDY